jgi:catechol 2,3-dioxygenase-like lactoylglutathione lyase family enzyme
MTTSPEIDRGAEWAALRANYLAGRDERPASTAQGIHHVALVCSDVERTINFYQGLLGFPLTALFENRDYPGSTHLFFDIGNGNALAFFDFPGLKLGPYAEVLAGLHHLALSVSDDAWNQARVRLDEAGVAYDIRSGSSIYLRGPDGERLELLASGLGRMYGETF